MSEVCSGEPLDPVTGAKRVKERARAEGFDLVGIARAEPLPSEHLDKWLDNGWDAGLWYVRGSRDARLDPSLVCPGARSVVVVAVAYYHPDPERPEELHGVVSRYARNRDYHNVMRKPLQRLRSFIDRQFPGSRAYVSCDTRPVAEKAWAQKAGLGWVGKNGCLIAPPYGSWVLLGSIVTTAEIAPDQEHPQRCGTCTACLIACPTDALPEPGFVDAGRCISFHTIEHRDPFPDDVARGLGDWLFGCDTCQDVCPWNRRPDAAGFGKLHDDFAPRPGHAFVPLESLFRKPEVELQEQIRGTPLARAKVEGLRRTAKVIAGEE